MADNNYALTTQPPTAFTNPSGVLIADYTSQVTATPAGSAYNVATPTQVAGVNVSAVLELQSTTGALLVSRMTTTQRNALVTVANGMCIYNTSTTTFQFYQNGSWVSLSAGAGGVTGPGSSTDNAVARWDGAGGTAVQDSVVLIGDTGAVTGVLSIANAVGTAGAPSYTFTGFTTNGFFSSGAGHVGVAASGVQQFSVTNTASSVNYLSVTGGPTNAGNIGLQPVIGAIGTDTNIDVMVLGKGTGGLSVYSPASASASIKLWNAAATFYTKLQAGVAAANVTFTLPIVDATTAGAPLTSNAAGALTFANDGMLSKSATLASADILGMFATPVEILPAAAANTMYVIHRFMFELVAGTQYAGGGNVGLQYDTTANLGGTAATAVIASSVVNAAASTAISVSGALAATARTGLVAKSITISNAAGAFTTGTGTAKYTVWYSVVSI